MFHVFHVFHLIFIKLLEGKAVEHMSNRHVFHVFHSIGTSRSHDARMTDTENPPAERACPRSLFNPSERKPQP